MKTLLLKILAVAALSIGAMLVPLVTALFAVGTDDYGRPLVNIKQFTPLSRAEICKEYYEARYYSRDFKLFRRNNAAIRRFDILMNRCFDCDHSSRDNSRYWWEVDVNPTGPYEIIPVRFFTIFDSEIVQTGRYGSSWREPKNPVYVIPNTYTAAIHLSYMAASYKTPNLRSLDIFNTEYLQRQYFPKNYY
jgi:hypothetical protein